MLDSDRRYRIIIIRILVVARVFGTRVVELSWWALHGLQQGLTSGITN